MNNNADPTTQEGERQLTHEEIWDDTLLIKQYDETMDKARVALAQKLPSSSATEPEDSYTGTHRAEVNHSGHPHTYSHSQRKKKHKGRRRNEWQVGDPCRATYSEDNCQYEATIIGMNQASGTCTVRYIGYDNYEDVAISSLLRSHGEAVRKKQLFEAQPIYSESEDTADDSSVFSDVPMEDEHRASGRSKAAFSSMMPPPEVPPARQANHSVPHLPNLPPPPALGLVDDGDSISSEALHTMLMSWYMTGYHTGYYQGLANGRKGTSNPTHKHGRKHHRYAQD